MTGIQKESVAFVWAKSDREHHSRDRGGHVWNPLTAHMLDVAACCEQLWDRYLAAPARLRLAEAFGGGDDATARIAVMFLAALHDLGKASPCFLRQLGRGRYDDRELRTAGERWVDDARAAGLPLPNKLDAAPEARHEHLTAALLPQLLGCDCARCHGVGPDNEALHTVASLLGGHHGHIPDADTVAKAPRATHGEDWHEVHRQLLAVVAETIGAPVTEVPALLRLSCPSTLPLFTGLVVLADWIASHEEWFPYRLPTQDTAECWRLAREQAKHALDETLLDAWDPPAAIWSDLWPGTSPRPFQHAAMQLLPARGSALVIVESDTGSGKTNLALWCAHHLARTNGYHGLYMAMPTRSASNKTAATLRQFLEADPRTDTKHNLALVYAGASTSDISCALVDAAQTDNPHQGALTDLAIDPKHEPEDAEVGATRAVLLPLYLREHLGLISPFGIGTLDQMMLGAQRHRYWFLRMFGLANKTVIIDEAHAYELYQERLLGAALSWLADAGASVVVLSATLPEATREHLIDSWCQGLRKDARRETTSGPITVVDDDGHVRCATLVHPSADRHIRYNLLTDQGSEALARQLLSQGAAGGVTAVIRNRVAQAANLHKSVLAQAEQYGWNENEIVLVHGSQLPRDRQPRETDLVEKLEAHPDRDTPNPRRPARMLVISTSVIEHSLDIDVDRMYSDLAPIDLLIQRCGRMHRHTANDAARKPWCAKPLLTVLWTPSQDGLPHVEPPDERAAHTEGNLDGRIYSPYALAAAWHTLHIRPTTTAECDQNEHHQDDERAGIRCFRTPGDSRELIEATYGQLNTPAAPIGDLLRRLRTAWEVSLEQHKAQAVRALYPFSPTGETVGIDELMSGRAHGGSRIKATPGIAARARLGERYVEVTVLYRHPETGITYDPNGELRVDLAYYRARGDRATLEARRRQQRDLMLNTTTIPARWFSGPTALPPVEEWEKFSEPALKYRNVLMLHPDGTFDDNSPVRLSYTPTTGLRRARRSNPLP